MSSKRRVVCWFSMIVAVFSCAGYAQVSPSTVVAAQGDAVITLTDIDAFAQTIPEKDRAAFFDNPQRLETLIGSMLVTRQLATEARTEGLDRDDLVRAQIAIASDDVLAKARMKKLREDIKVPDLSELAREEYVGHKEKYVVDGHKKTFAEAKERIIARLRAEYTEKQAKTHTDILHNEPIKADAGLVASLRTRYANQSAVAAPLSPPTLK